MKRGHSYYDLYYHLIWHTKKNFPYLDGRAKAIAYDCVSEICRRSKVELMALNGPHDHVHLLIRSTKWLDIPDFMRQIKGSSSHEVSKHAHLNLFWQNGYSVHSVSCKHAEKLIEYIARQEEHHAA